MIPLEDSNASVLMVGWPMYGSNETLKVVNHTTGDSRTKRIYIGAPEFTLFAGDYSLGGLQVAEGDNDLYYEIGGQYIADFNLWVNL